jgi:flagellin-like hook-associated protein FlgL
VTEDVDLAQAVVDLQTQQNIYQATAALAAQVGRLQLLDFLL